MENSSSNKYLIITFLFCIIIYFPVFSATYFVATSGSDSNLGTADLPFKTIEKAFGLLNPGDTAFVMPGNYSYGHIRLANNDGEADALLHLFAYDNTQKPVISSKLSIDHCSYLHIKGFEITVGKMRMSGPEVHHCIIENLDVHHVDAQQGLSIEDLAHDNLILNCDFHHNVQFAGSNCDGIAIWANDPNSTNGPYNNTVRYCRSYFNNDDGFDTWCSGSNNRFEYCWSYGNGCDSDFNEIDGDGNGFKLGQGNYNYPVVIHCLAWKNKVKGFDENFNQAGGVTVYNCTSFDNGSNNFEFWSNPKTDVVKNCISVEGNVIMTGAKDSSNNWNIGIKATASDFITMDYSRNMGPRKPDGSLPDSDFLKLKPDSKLAGKGIDVGLPFDGNAPNLGAY